SDLLSLSHMSQNRKSSDNNYGCGSFLFRHRSDAQVALQQSPILQNDIDKSNFPSNRTLRSSLKSE
ncbi:MAG TPA: hypothetical protein VLH16_01535, partial [Bacteroidales bacterium]|nr:hypothetical protein [Bacteroidales bacterium]